jgi:hypothetical protein
MSSFDNAKYFDNAMFKDFCKQMGTKVSFASVYHRQSNRVVERANSLIFEAIKKILEGEMKGKWAEVMPTAMWCHNTTVCRATNSTPFRLMYGAKAVLPEEIKHQRPWTTTEATACPKEAEDEDLLESDRLKAIVSLEKHQEEPRAWRKPKVKLREFKAGNLVLLWSPCTDSTGKFEGKWTGLYVGTEKMRPDAYRLSDTQGRVLEHSCNAENLHRFYV